MFVEDSPLLPIIFHQVYLNINDSLTDTWKMLPYF